MKTVYKTTEYPGIIVNINLCDNGLYSAGYDFFENQFPCKDEGIFKTELEAINTVCSIISITATEYLNKPVGRVDNVNKIFASNEFRKWNNSRTQTLF